MLATTQAGWADDVTKNYTSFGAGQSGDTRTITTFSSTGVDVTGNKNYVSVSSSRILLSPTGTLNFSCKNASKIKALTITWRDSKDKYPTAQTEYALTTTPSGDGTHSFSVNSGTNAGSVTTWINGNATTIAVTNNHSSKTFEITGISITYSKSDLETFAFSSTSNENMTVGGTDATPHSWTATYGGSSVSSNISNKVTYVSSNTSVATIVNGKIHPVAAGTTTITAQLSGSDLYNDMATTNSYQVTVGGGGSDTTAPTLSSSTPGNGATGVATSGTIVLTFNEAIASVDATKFSLSSGTKDGVAIDGSDNTKVNITYSGMANNTAITLSTAAEAVADAAGNKSAALSNITFTTAAAATKPATPVLSPTGGTYSDDVTVTISKGNSSDDVKLYYRVDNSAYKEYPNGDWTEIANGGTVTLDTKTKTKYLSVYAVSNADNTKISDRAEGLYTHTEATTPSIAFSSPTTTVAVGATVTNTATLTNASGTTITYSSSDTSVATVNSSTGEVTGEAAGTATITATYTENSTDYIDSYTITVTAAPTPSAGQTWDFTTTWNKTADEIKASSEWNNDKRNESALANAELTVDGTKIDVTEGLKFTSGAKYVELHPDEYIILRNNATTFTVPNVAAGSTITISTCGDSGNSGVQATTTNVTKTSGSNSSSPSDFVFSVTTTGDCSFARAQGTNTRIYKITVTSAVTVADPTVTPVTDANFSASPKSVTFTTNEAGGTTYYVIGASRETNAATIAAGTQADEGANNVDVSTFVTNESNAVISAVTKKGNEYSNIVYVDLTYNGTITAKIGNDDNVDIQQGNYATITPFITDGAGNKLMFDQDDDASIDYSQYYTFTYAVKSGTTPSQYCSLDATTGKVNTRETISEVDYKAAVGATITVTVTATPKTSPAVTLNYVKNEVLTKDITFTVIAEDQTVTTQWVDFYWDEDCTTPITTEDDGVTGPAKSQNMTFTDFPNGKVIYAKVNKQYADMICFYYNNKDTSKPTAEVSKVDGMTSISNNNGKKYRYRQCLPIYTDANGAGTDGGKVWVTLGGYKENADATVGKFINMEFTIKANSSRPAAPTYTPYTSVSEYDKKAANAAEVRADMTKMTTAKASTANGASNGTVMAKYSTNNSYTIIELVSLPSDDNPRTLNVGKGSVGVFSTVPTKDTQVRKTTGVQVVDGVISPISNAFYNYYPAQNEVTLKFDPEEVTVHTTGANAKVFTKPTLNITAKDVSHITPITYSIVSGGEGRISDINASTGDITFVENPTPGVVVIKARYAGEAYGDDTYAPAEATYTIYMVDPSKEVVLIKPGSRTFTTEQEVVIEGANTWTGYYTTSTTADDVTFDADTWNVIEPGTTTTLHVTETTTVQAMVVDPSDHTAKNRTKQTYTKKTVAPPTLYPDGVTSTYYFTTGELKDGKLAIVAATTEPMANVYYVVDDDPSILTNGGGTRYIGTDKIQIDGSKTTTYVYAVTQDAEGNRSAVVRGVYTKSSDVKQPAFKVNEDGTEFASGEIKTIAASDKVYIIDKSNETGAVTYFTMDGSSPTTSSQTYTGAFHINKSGTVVKAITVHGGNVSPISTATFNLAASSENRFWEANSSTCDSNGKLEINGGKSGAVINKTTDPVNGVDYITATFGGIYKDSKDVWKHEKIGEESKGEPIDGVGTYQISTGYDALDETCILQGSESAMYNHANSATTKAVHERTFTLPARGAYVRFEPEKDGDLTIWALQNGGVYYNESSDGKENFLSGFIRKRPVYMVDEQGNCLAATEVKAAGTLSSKWGDINRDDLLGKEQPDHSQGGIAQNLFTTTEAQSIYDMYSAKIDDAPNTDMNNLIVYLNDGTHAAAASAGIEGGDNSTGTNIGVCIPSASYMRYTYKVRAGKTYFFFASRTKLGIRGFRFDPSTEGLPTPDATGVTTSETGTTNSTAINTAAVKNEGKTVTRKFTTGRTLTAGKWYGLVLPFSISESKLKTMFDDGNNTMSILHFRTVEGSKIYLRKHYHQMIVAGTPVLIYVTKTGTLDFDEVQVEAASPVAITSNGYSFTGTFDQITLPRYAYYINTTGGFSQWTSESSTNLKSMRSYMTSPTQGARRLTFAANNYDDEDDEQIVTGIEYLFYDDDATKHFGNSDVYNLNGQIVRKNATSLIGLPKGIYIVNGKKIAVK